MTTDNRPVNSRTNLTSEDVNSADLTRIAVVSPVYNDWPSYYRLVEEIDRELGNGEFTLHLFAVDDGSNDGQVLQSVELTLDGSVARLELLRLASNVGHQRAVAVGLSELAQRPGYAAVAVMDADGEDRPADLARLIQAYSADPSQIFVAKRAKRSEGWWFRILYRAYRVLFRILVGVRVDFGNFCVIPITLLNRLVYDSNSWNHLAATIIRSKAPFRSLETARGMRYSDQSKMGLEPFVLHGLSAISVFADMVFVRAIMAFMLIACLALLGILAVVGIRLFTDLAIPGWATTSVGLLLVIALQALLFSAIAAFMLLSQRSGPTLIPATDSLRLIESREVLYSRDAS